MRDLTGEWQRQDLHPLAVSSPYFERIAPRLPTYAHVNI